MKKLRHARETLPFWPAWHWQRLRATTINLLEKPPIIPSLAVSVTSYPARFNTLALCLESLFRQSVKPEKLILVVSATETRQSPLPLALTEMGGSRIEIIYDEGNIGSYKKIIPIVERYPEYTIVTCDDDKIYPPNWLKQLVRASHHTPQAIICHRGRLGRGRSDGNWAPYASWPSCNHDRPSMEVFPIGAAGVLYPPASLDPIVSDRHLALEVAPTADDLWLKLAAWKCGRPARQVRRKPALFTSIPVKSGHLSNNNLIQGNDVALMHMERELGFTPGSVLLPDNIR